MPYVIAACVRYSLTQPNRRSSSLTAPAGSYSAPNSNSLQAPTVHRTLTLCILQTYSLHRPLFEILESSLTQRFPSSPQSPGHACFISEMSDSFILLLTQPYSKH